MTLTRRNADITPSLGYLHDLAARLERLAAGEEDVPIGMSDLLTLRMALKTATAAWRPVAGLTLSEMTKATALGADAWPPILATSKMTPRDFASAVSEAGNLADKRAEEFEKIFLAVTEVFGLAVNVILEKPE